MGVREALNQKPALSAGITLVVLAAVLFFIVQQFRGSEASELASGPQAYYSDDDGKTVFRAEANKLPPFQHGSKQAVGAFVMPKDDGTNTVLYLIRYTPAGKELKLHPKPSSLDDPAYRSPDLLSQTEIKKPGDKEWVKMNDPKAATIMRSNQ